MKEVVKHVWLVHSGDGYKPGWYFDDETAGLNGPFETQEIAERMLQQYIESWL